MSILPRVKICGLTREEDVDLALELGADYCGFIVYSKSPRGLSLARATELAARVPLGKRVVVDVATEPEALQQMQQAGFDHFQIHSKSAGIPASLPEWAAIVGKAKLWMAPRLAPSDAWNEELFGYADTFLIDTFARNQIGGTGEVGDWSRFRDLQQAYPQTNWILAGGLTPENVSSALASTGTAHLDINSGVESQPGIKDAGKLREVFQVLRESKCL